MGAFVVETEYFPYKGYYDPEKDEYIPDCKKCYGEGWVMGKNNPIPCICNPRGLFPKDDI